MNNDNSKKRPSWDQVYMNILEQIVQRSTCLFVNAAAIIVDPNSHNIVGIWYSGSCRWDVHCADVGCAKIIDWVEHKHADLCRGAHAELNAIVNCSVDTRGLTMYTLLSPCNNCAKHIVNAWIKKLVYNKTYLNKNYEYRILDFMARLGVEVLEFKSDENSKNDTKRC